MNAAVANFISTEILFKAVKPAPVGIDLGDTTETIHLQALYDRALPDVEGNVAAADWEAIEQAANDLLLRSIDMRFLVIVAAAALRTRGVAAFAEVVRTIATLVGDHWLQWFPRSEEGGDPGSVDADWRGNILANLAERRVLGGLRDLKPFPQSRLGALTLSSLLVGRDGKQPETQAVAAAFAEQPALAKAGAKIQQELVDVAGAVEHIGKSLADQWSVYIDLAPLSGLCRNAANALQQALADKVLAPGASNSTSTDLNSTMPQGGNAMSATSNAHADGLSRDSAKAVLQQLIEFFSRTEPSSPIPLYLQRAQSLIGLDFKQVVRQMGDDVQALTRESN